MGTSTQDKLVMLVSRAEEEMARGVLDKRKRDCDHARAALDAYVAFGGTDDDVRTTVQDLITDLLHLVSGLGHNTYPGIYPRIPEEATAFRALDQFIAEQEEIAQALDLINNTHKGA